MWRIFFSDSHKSNVFAVSVKQARIASEDRIDGCEIDYDVDIDNILLGPNYRILTFCSDLSLTPGKQYLVFITPFSNQDKVFASSLEEVSGLFNVIVSDRPDWGAYQLLLVDDQAGRIHN